MASLPGTFRALGHRNFRLLWLGQVVSLTGSWMQSVAQGWLVLRLTDSAFLLGLVGFCSYSPVLFLSLWGGVAADRWARRRALLFTQGAAMVLALILAVFTWNEAVTVWHVAVIAFGLGTVTAFDIPIRQAFLLEIVGRDDLQNAIALNSMAFNGARLIGPALAGLLLARLGEAFCFFVNALSFTAVLAGLAGMRLTEGGPEKEPGRPWIDELVEGLAYARRSPRVKAILVLVAVSSFFGMPYAVLMPAFARDVLGLGSQGLGLLMGAAGAGALAGAGILATRRTTQGSGLMIPAAMVLFGGGIVGFSYSGSPVTAMILLMLVGAGMIVQMATSNTQLQLSAPPELRGRIVSLYTLAFLGTIPLGSLASGIVARAIGVEQTIRLGGAICIIAALLFSLKLRRGVGRQTVVAAPAVSWPSP